MVTPASGMSLTATPLSGSASDDAQTITVASTTSASSEDLTLGTILVYRNGNTNDTQKKTVTVKKAAPQQQGETTVTWTASSGAIAGTTSGTIENGDYDWSFTRSSVVYTGWTSPCIQLGSKSGAEQVTFMNSNFPGTIKRVSVECSSYSGAHKVSITVGGVEYLASTSTASWTTVSTASGTGSASGEIVISFTGGTRALYIKSISVTYSNN